MCGRSHGESECYSVCLIYFYCNTRVTEVINVVSFS